MTSDAIRNFLFSMSIVFPTFVGVMRFRKIGYLYRPFLIYIFVSFLNELLVGLIILPHNKKADVVNWNLFNLFEAIIFFIQFYYWNQFDKYKKKFPFLIFLVVFGWLIENFFYKTIFNFNPIFLLCYSFILLLLIVQTINFIIVNERRFPLIKNAMFIICVGMMVYFIYDIFVWTLIASGIKETNKKLIVQVFTIKVYINALANILYGIALLFVQKKVSGKDLFKDLQ